MGAIVEDDSSAAAQDISIWLGHIIDALLVNVEQFIFICSEYNGIHYGSSNEEAWKTAFDIFFQEYSESVDVSYGNSDILICNKECKLNGRIRKYFFDDWMHDWNRTLL